MTRSEPGAGEAQGEARAPGAGEAQGEARAPGRRVAWFHCFAGIAGDMALGSLVDAGADLGELRSLLGRLPLKGWRLDASRVLRGGVAATRVEVVVDEPGDATRHLADVLDVIERGKLPRRVHERAAAVFSALAAAEGAVHGIDPSEVHFHEVGAHDAIVDVVGTAAALELLEVDEVAATPVAIGTGLVRSSHGALPNPAPAVARLLTGIAVTGVDVPFELTTPTGAAFVAAWASRIGPVPDITVERAGYGAGSRDLEGLPNCTQVVVGWQASVTGGTAGDTGRDAAQPLVLVEANLDDATGEQLADAVATLLESGALDAWVTPVLMKKGRPGHVVSVLADVARAGGVRQVLLSTTGSFGARSHLVDRYAAARHFEVLEVLDGSVRMKVSRGRVKVEHDDALALARRHGLPMQEVVAAAERAWEARQLPPREV